MLIVGEILVWDFREQDSLIARVLERQDLHRDSVTSLQWIREPKLAKKKFIVSFLKIFFSIFLKIQLNSLCPLVKMDEFFYGILCPVKII